MAAGSTVELPPLRADCSACEGLCCMAAAFDAGADFAYDKSAGAPCRHLRGDNGCAIHDRRAQEGFGGCVGYDCLGAGQRVVAEILPGVSWRNGPAQKQRVIAAFLALREIHRLLELLVAAANLPLASDQENRRQALLARLNPPGGWTEQSLARVDPAQERAKVAAYLSSLADIARAQGHGPTA